MSNKRESDDGQELTWAALIWQIYAKTFRQSPFWLIVAAAVIAGVIIATGTDWSSLQWISAVCCAVLLLFALICFATGLHKFFEKSAKRSPPTRFSVTQWHVEQWVSVLYRMRQSEAGIRCRANFWFRVTANDEHEEPIYAEKDLKIENVERLPFFFLALKGKGKQEKLQGKSVKGGVLQLRNLDPAGAPMDEIILTAEQTRKEEDEVFDVTLETMTAPGGKLPSHEWLVDRVRRIRGVEPAEDPDRSNAAETPP